CCDALGGAGVAATSVDSLASTFSTLRGSAPLHAAARERLTAIGHSLGHEGSRASLAEPTSLLPVWGSRAWSAAAWRPASGGPRQEPWPHQQHTAQRRGPRAAWRARRSARLAPEPWPHPHHTAAAAAPPADVPSTLPPDDRASHKMTER